MFQLQNSERPQDLYSYVDAFTLHSLVQSNRLLGRMQDTQLYLLLRVFKVPLPPSITP